MDDTRAALHPLFDGHLRVDGETLPREHRQMQTPRGVLAAAEARLVVTSHGLAGLRGLGMTLEHVELVGHRKAAALHIPVP